MNSRLYFVLNKKTDEKVLVIATSQRQAINHIAEPIYEATIATALEVARWSQAGHAVQDATLEPEVEAKPEPAKPEPERHTVESLTRLLNAAESLDALDDRATLITTFTSRDQKSLNSVYMARRAEFDAATTA